jgi:hypothetical protein
MIEQNGKERVFDFDTDELVEVIENTAEEMEMVAILPEYSTLAEVLLSCAVGQMFLEMRGKYTSNLGLHIK